MPAARIVFLLFTFCRVSSAFAASGFEPGDETGPDSSLTGPVYHLPPLVIDAPRPLSPTVAASTIRVEVDSLPLSAAPVLEEVLREVPLLYVRTNTRGEAELSARGSESRHVAILVDGIPITLAWDARADVSIIPATAFREVEFVRGLSSMLFGPNVTGGILEVRVARSLVQPESPTTQVSLSADHVGSIGTTLRTALPLEGQHHTWLLQGGMGFRDTPGAPLASGVVDRVPTENDLRLNTDARQLDGFLSLRYRAAEGSWVSLSGLSSQAERGVASELGVPEDDARFWRYPHVSRTLLIASGGTGPRTSPFGGRGGVELNFGYDTGRTEIDAFTSPAYDTLDSFEDGSDRTLTLRLLADQDLGSRGDLRGSFTAAEVRHDESLPEGDFRYRQQLWSAGLEGTWRLMETRGRVEHLDLSVGGAYDVAVTPETGGKEALGRLEDWGARVGLSMPLADGRTAMHAGLSRRGRFPALRELYSGALNRFAPNPDLQPEGTVTADLGVTSRRGPVEVQAVLFHHRVDDAVVRVLLEDGRFMRINRDELRTFGGEFLGSYTRGRFGVSGHLHLQDAALTDSESDQTNEPENLPEVLAGVGAHVPVYLGILLGLDVQYTGSQFAIDPVTGEDATLPDASLLGGYLSRAWRLGGRSDRQMFSRLTTRVAVVNASDALLYDNFGLPEPGRCFRFELRLD